MYEVDVVFHSLILSCEAETVKESSPPAFFYIILVERKIVVKTKVRFCVAYNLWAEFFARNFVSVHSQSELDVVLIVAFLEEVRVELGQAGRLIVETADRGFLRAEPLQRVVD